MTIHLLANESGSLRALGRQKIVLCLALACLLFFGIERLSKIRLGSVLGEDSAAQQAHVYMIAAFISAAFQSVQAIMATRSDQI